MNRPFDQMLSSARECLKEADDLTPEMNEQLDKMRNIDAVEQKLQAMTTTQNEKIGRIETLKKACKSVTQSFYIFLKCCTAALAKALGLIKDESHLPEMMQIKINGIRRYLEKLKEKNNDLAALTGRIMTMVMESSVRDFKISQEEMNELEKIMMKHEIGLKVAENWQKNAEEEWESLYSEITSHLKEAGVIALVKVAAGTTIAAAGGAALVASGGAAYLVAEPQYKVIAGSISGLASVLQAIYQVYSVYGEYKKLRAKCEELRVDLNYNKADEEESKITADIISKKISGKATVTETGEHITGNLC